MIEVYGLNFNTQAALGCFILVYGFVILAFNAYRTSVEALYDGIDVVISGWNIRFFFGIFAALAGGLLL